MPFFGIEIYIIPFGISLIHQFYILTKFANDFDSYKTAEELRIKSEEGNKKMTKNII